MRSLPVFILIVGLICLLIPGLMLGCSSGGSNPASPALSASRAQGSIPSARPAASGESSILIPWGVYDISWAPGDGGVRVGLMRSAGSTLNVSVFSDDASAGSADVAVRITDRSRCAQEGIVGLDVSITHPFDNPAMTVFDVMGIVIADGDLRLLNADGYTPGPADSAHAADGVAANVNGYKYFAEGIGPNENLEDYFAGPVALENRGAFLPGTTITRNYLLKLPVRSESSRIHFQFEVIAHWRSAVDAVGERIADPSVEDFPLWANASEPVYIGCDTADSSLYYVDEANRGGEIVLDMTVWDWQLSLTFGDITGQVSAIVVESPSGLLPSGPVVFGREEIRDALQSCCSAQYSTRLRFVIPGATPDCLEEELLIGVSSPDGSTAYASVAPVIHDHYVPPLRESVDLVLVLADTPWNLNTEVREQADRAYAEMFEISDRIKDIYRDNRGSEHWTSVQSLVSPLATRLADVREARAAYVTALLHQSLDSMQDRATQALQSIPDTTVTNRDLVLNSLGVRTTREHVEEIESLPFVYEVSEGMAVAPLTDISAQSLLLRPGTYPEVVWDQGFHGEGFDALLIDLGMLASHPAFTGLEIISEKFPPTAPGCESEGPYGHGTSCAGIMASQDATYTGMAYGIETLYNAKLCSGYDAFQTLQQAYQWAGIGGTGYNDAEVVSMSLVFTTSCTQRNGLNIVSAYVDGTVDLYGAMWSLGAGNRGTGCPYDYISDKPQTCYNGVSVVSVNVNNDTGTRDDDDYWTGSKYGPCYGPYSSEERLKPEVMTPTNVTTTSGGGGWGDFPGTSAAAPHYAGVVDVLYSAGVGSSLEMRALTFATAEDYTASPASVGVDYYTGFGYVDAWAAYSHIADTFADTLISSGEGHYYSVQNVQEGDRIVLVYDKHGTYPSWQISNLDLKVYDLATGDLLYETTKIYENKEYVEIAAADVGKDVVVTVVATSLADGVTAEQYAVSANTTMTAFSSPELAVTINAPADRDQYDVFEMTADVENVGGIAAEAVSADLVLPAGWQLVVGDDPQDLGDIPSGEIKTAEWTVFAPISGLQTVSVEASCSFFGASAVGEDSADINIHAISPLTAPASVGEYDVFIVTASYTNNSPMDYTGLSFSLDFDSDALMLLSGENPAPQGDVTPGNSADEEWIFLALADGTTPISLDVDFTYDGQPVSFSTPDSPVVVSNVELLTCPDTVERDTTFQVLADYTNNSPGTYEGLSFTLGFTADKLSLESGENPAPVGDVPSGEKAHREWELKAIEEGAAQVWLEVSFAYGGASADFSTPPVDITIEPPYVDPFAPILLAPPDGTNYLLGQGLTFRWEKASGTNPSAYYLDVWVDGVHSPLVPVGGVNMGQLTSLYLPPKFIELNARDGMWEWAVGAQLGPQVNWSGRWAIDKHVAPALIQPPDGAQVGVGQVFDWENSPGAVNYVARVTGILPAGKPYYLPLNSAVSQFQLTQPYYKALKTGVTYTWAVAGTALGAYLPASDQDTLARLSYSEARSFTRQ